MKTRRASGEIVGGYELVRVLGRGGASTVWLGRHVQTGSVAAIKRLHSDRPSRFQSLERERRAIARLAHPHVVQLFGWGDGFTIMQHVDGDDAQRRLERAPIRLDLALTWIQHVGSALHLAHERGVIHGDVKPSNILVDTRGNAWLSDFGASVLSTETRAGRSFAGTPGFMAPERLGGAAPTPLSDQYELARTLLTLLSGGEAPREVGIALARLAGVAPDPLRGALARASSGDPARRFPAVGDFLSALAAVSREAALRPGPLAPILRSPAPFSWAATPAAAAEVAPSLFRLDHEIAAPYLGDSPLARLVDSDSAYERFAFSVVASSEELGLPGRAEACARARAVIVLMHGLHATRESWMPIATRLARDHGRCVVLIPDLYGAGATRVRRGTARARLSPARTIRHVLQWIDALGFDDVSRVLVGHSHPALGLASVREEELGARARTVLVSPFFPYLSARTARLLRLPNEALRALNLVPPLARRILQRQLQCSCGAAAPCAHAETAPPPHAVLGMIDAALDQAPLPGNRLRTARVIMGARDRLTTPEILERALESLAVVPTRVEWLPTAGHFPHAESAERPEWTAHHRAEIAHLISAAIDEVLDAETVPGGAAAAPPTVHSADLDMSPA